MKFIRNEPEKFDEGIKKRGIMITSEALLNLDKSIRNKKTILNEMQRRRNEISAQIGKLGGLQLSNSDVLTAVIEESEEIKEKMFSLRLSLHEEEKNLENLLLTLPNIPAPEAPIGESEVDNVEIRCVGTRSEFNFEPKQHFEFGPALGMDFEAGVKISGSRFVVLHQQLAALERALSNFMLDMHTNEFGYKEVSVPLLVRDNAMIYTGQLPKFSEESFTVSDSYRLIPTAEVPLTSMFADTILEIEALPIRHTAYTQCFRSEAGSYGKDVRGMIRLHQFSKVELVSITTADQSSTEHERMLSIAEEVLKRLELPYRVMLLCTGDMGFAANKTYDIEVWLPGQKCYREISSCSNCGDFQARRMSARYRTPSGNENVHTLNGSALPLGRTIVAILENYQQADGSVIIPAALKKYMSLEKLDPICS